MDWTGLSHEIAVSVDLLALVGVANPVADHVSGHWEFLGDRDEGQRNGPVPRWSMVDCYLEITACAQMSSRSRVRMWIARR